MTPMVWIGAILVSAAGLIYFWGSWWAVPFIFVYGVAKRLFERLPLARMRARHRLSDRLDERGRLQVASFMLMRNPVTWRWSHSRHHTDTIIVGRDAEIAVMRPPDLRRTALNFFGLVDGWRSLIALLRNAIGILTPNEKNFIPEPEQHKAVRAARVRIAIYAATLALALVWRSWLPLMIIGLPRLYGCWHMVLTGLLQHGGLADNVVDHRLNSRTVYLNPISRFLYWNAETTTSSITCSRWCHIHALPRLHALIKHYFRRPVRRCSTRIAK